MQLTRGGIAEKIFVGMFFGVCLMLCLPGASDARYPEKIITIEVGYAPGGSTDVSTRTLAKFLEKYLKQKVVVVNKPGAGSTIEMESVKKAVPDGYTLGTITTGAILRAAVTEVPYKLFEDYTFVCQYGEWLHGIAVSVDSQWKTMKDLVNFAKQNPGKIKYATMPPGTHIALVAAQFGKLNGIDWVHVKYDGDAPSATAVVGKHVDVCVTTPLGWNPFVKSGDLRLLGTFEQRFKEYPEIPMISELGYRYSTEFRGFVGLLGPKGIPQDVLNTLKEACRKAWNDPGFQKGMDEIMLPAVYREGKEWIDFLKQYDKEGNSIMKDIGFIQ
jgi:tripartite-type tricarboxylate transporter receptor subunit TctC